MFHFPLLFLKLVYNQEKMIDTPFLKKKSYKFSKNSLEILLLFFPGLPESILAAAFSRIGQRVLHIDRYDSQCNQ